MYITVEKMRMVWIFLLKKVTQVCHVAGLQSGSIWVAVSECLMGQTIWCRRYIHSYIPVY